MGEAAVHVGSVLIGFCGGYFGRDSHADKRVEAVGADWVVARNMITGGVEFAFCGPQDLIEFVGGERYEGATTECPRAAYD